MSKLSKKQEKKRQQRLRERERNNPAALAYHGNKYRTDALVMPLMETETSILEAFIVLDRNLTDHDVGRALVRLIDLVRRGNMLAENRPLSIAADDPSAAVVQLVCLKWQAMGERLPGRNNLVGILRTILGSVENHQTVKPASQNYLNFVEGFLAKLGVQVQLVPESMMRELTPAAAHDDDRNTIDAEFDCPGSALPK